MSMPKVPMHDVADSLKALCKGPCVKAAAGPAAAAQVQDLVRVLSALKS